MTHRATAMPIQLSINTKFFVGVPHSNRPEKRGHRLHFLDGGELHDWLRAFFGHDWSLTDRVASQHHLSWLLVSDNALVGRVHVYTDVGLTSRSTRRIP